MRGKEYGIEVKRAFNWQKLVSLYWVDVQAFRHSVMRLYTDDTVSHSPYDFSMWPCSDKYMPKIKLRDVAHQGDHNDGKLIQIGS
jgi:hypothetical protein